MSWQGVDTGLRSDHIEQKDGIASPQDGLEESGVGDTAGDGRLENR